VYREKAKIYPLFSVGSSRMFRWSIEYGNRLSYSTIIPGTPSEYQSMSGPVEYRAKRTHARRSCDLCKLRKTRCELPDLDVVAGPEPQSFEKSCHRCQVLSLPCIVDDTKGKPKVRGEDAGPSRAGSSTSLARDRGSSPKRRRTARPSNGSAGETKTLASVVNDSLELMHSFDEELDPSLRKPSAESTPTGFGVISGSQIGNWQIERERSMKYHGRPAELVSAMLTVAYGRVKTIPPRSSFMTEVDLGWLIDEPMRIKLEPGYVKLRTYHPHLVPLSNLLSSTDEAAGLSRPLLISVSVYLSTLVLAPSIGQRLREVLTPYIYALRDAVLLQVPQSFTTLQALELLAVHAPFGVLPLNSTRLSSLVLSRGTIASAVAVSTEVNAGAMIRSLLRLGNIHTWMATDTWTYLSMCAAEAAYKLEDEIARAPANLADARNLAEMFYDPEDLEIWRNGVGITDEADFVGRLHVCDKLLRTAEVLDSLSRSRAILDNAAKDVNFEATEAMEVEFKYAFARLEDLDRKHDAIYGKSNFSLPAHVLIPGLLLHKSDISTGVRTYRHFRRRYENIKILVVGLRCLMAVQFVNDPATPQPRVPSAMIRAYNPTECMPLLEDGSKPYTRLVWQWGRVRGDFADQIMGSSADLLDGILQAGRYALAPMIEVMCCTVESAKNLLEMQAWKIAVYRVHRPILHEARFPPWIESMRAASTSMLRLAGFTTNTSMKGFEPIANGCANLIASMGRIADDRSMMLDNHPDTASDHPTPVLQATNEHLNDLDAGRQVQSALISHHDYMNTSDRWMAGPPIGNENENGNGNGGVHPDTHRNDNGHHPPSQFDPAHQATATNGYPVMIDQILSEAFAYSYQPSAPAVSHPNTTGPVYNGDQIWHSMGNGQ
jgi:hypothetical protein